MLANRNGCVAGSAISLEAWLRGPTITSPNHLEIRTAHGMFVLGRPAAFPPEVCAAAAHHGPMLALSNVRSDPFAIAGVQRWLQKTEFALPTRLANDRDVLRRVERGIAEKRLVALYVADHPAPISRPLANAGAQRVPAARLPMSAALSAAQRADAEVSAMDADDRVLAALQRSGKYMGTLLEARFKELFTPETLLVLVAFLIAGALANTNPVTAAIFDGAMVAFVWYTVGRAGIEALGKLVSATVAAMAAKNEVQLEAAAKTYAEAVIGLGGAVFLAWLARRMGRPEGGGNRTVTALRPAAAEAPVVRPVPARSAQSTTPRPPPKRPSWRQSETDVGKSLDGQGFRSQTSFKDGAEVPYGTKGSTRPELYKDGLSIEVKNYNVETAQGRSNLIRNVSEQAKSRAANLPENTVQQVFLDVRGQQVTRAELNSVINQIVDKTGGIVKPENIKIVR